MLCHCLNCHQDLRLAGVQRRLTLRPNSVQASFTLGALTIGLRVAAANYAFETTVSVQCCWFGLHHFAFTACATAKLRGLAGASLQKLLCCY